MAPPELLSLENFSDVQFRDVFHRRSLQVAPMTGTGNVIQKLYTHMNGSTPVLSGVETLTTDGNNNNAQYSLLLSSNASPLSANSITSATLANLTAQSVMTLTKGNAIIRSTMLTANNITCNTITIGNDVSFGNVTTSKLTVNGDASIDTSSLRVDSSNNRVGIVKSAPAYTLDVGGDVNTTGVFRINGTQVLSASTFGVTGNAAANNVNAGQVVNAGTAYRIGNVNVLTSSTLALTGTGNAAVDLSAGGRYKILGNDVLTDSTLGTSITTSSLTTVGTLNSLNVAGDITALGNSIRLGSTQTITLTRKLTGNLVGSGVHLGNLISEGTGYNAPFTVEVTVSQRGTLSTGTAKNHNAYTTTFVIPYNPASVSFNSNGTSSPWRRALPRSESYQSGGGQNSVALDVAHHVPAGGGYDDARLGLALVRTRVGGTTVNSGGPNTTEDIYITLQLVSNGPSAVTLSPLSTDYIPPYLTGANPWDGSSPTNYYLGTPLAVKDGQVGIYTDNFDTPIDFQVNVRSRTRHGLWVENGEYGRGIIFGNMWRLAFNPNTQNLEIHKNNNVSDYDWTSFTTTGILGAQ